MVHASELMRYEHELMAQGCRYICGVDEVGRGPLAGPVTCAAVIMPLDDLIEGVNDSKKVAKKKRERLAELIKEKAVAYCVASYDSRKIDEMNILAATKACMAEAVAGLAVTPDVVIVDALTLDIPVRTFGIVHGDAQSYSIAAASILAKVERDAYMTGMDEVYPGYGFSSNAGYGTAAHIAALKELGPTPIHRRTFIGHFVDADE
ncbi:MAG TPA: ribonuclease HII [Candidatus Limadaptatus stercoravium]|nr:ribonuclease HII [Candidatus Limadaptatus stercoravium]